MAERIDNPWWSEGWRLVRERLPEVVTPRRRRVLAVVVVMSALVTGIGTGLLVGPDDGGPRSWPFIIVFVLLAVDLSVGITLAVWGRRDREPDFRAGRVSLGLEGVFDLSRPVPPLSIELRDEARVHVDRGRRNMPLLIVGSLVFRVFPLVALLVLATTGWRTTGAWMLLVVIATGIWQPFWLLKWLGSTTAQLRRIESAPEPPTYLGPKGWGIEAPRKAAGEDATPG